MNYLIGAIGGVFIVSGVLYFVLCPPRPKFLRRETDWEEGGYYCNNDPLGPDDSHAAEGD